MQHVKINRQYGEVSEWPKEHAWKVCIRKRIEGSTPSLTATFKERESVTYWFPFLLWDHFGTKSAFSSPFMSALNPALPIYDPPSFASSCGSSKVLWWPRPTRLSGCSSAPRMAIWNWMSILNKLKRNCMDRKPQQHDLGRARVGSMQPGEPFLDLSQATCILRQTSEKPCAVKSSGTRVWIRLCHKISRLFSTR
jgi:hypothetical protein